MELLGVLLLFGIMVIGCMTFYMFLQFAGLSRKNQELSRSLEDSLDRLHKKVDELKKA